MNKINHEYYVSLEVAKLLKEAGFNWEVEFFYRDGILRSVLPDELFNGDFEDIEYYYKHIGFPHRSLNYNDGSSKFLEEYSAPTLDATQRWLREVKKIHIEITFGGKWIYTPYNLTNLECLLSEDEFPKTRNYNTYEEAQEAGIKKALEIILEKEE